MATITEEGNTWVQALTKAQRDLIKGDTFKNPWFWAQYQLIGGMKVMREPSVPKFVVVLVCLLVLIAVGVFAQGDDGNTWDDAVELFNQAMEAYSQARFQDAIDLFEEALAIVRALDKYYAESAILNAIGVCYHSLSDYQKAIEYHEQSLAIERDIGDRSGEAASLTNLGSCYHSLSDYQKAIEYLEQALVIFREIGDRSDEAKSLNNLGLCYYSLSDYQKAIDYYEQSLAIYRDIGDRYGEAMSLNNLGSCYIDLSDYQKAIEYHEQSLAIKRDIGDRAGEAMSLNNLGSCYYSLSDYQKAIDYYEQSLVIEREIGDRSGETNSLMGLGNCYYSLFDYQKAIDYYEKSLAIARDIGDRSGEAMSLSNFGLCYYSLFDYQRAIEYYDQALALSVELGTRNTEQLIHWGLGRTYNALEDPETALTHYEAAIEIVESIRGKVSEEKLRQSYFGSMRTLYEEYLELLLELGRNERTMLVAERCRARTFLEFLAEGPVGTIENVAEEGISSGVVEPSAIEADVEEVVSSLPAGTAVLEYFVTDDATYVWVINRGEIRGPIQLEHGRAELMNKVIACREMLDAGQEGVNRDLAELYEWLIRPVEDLLPSTTGEGEVPHLIIIPSGPLYYLPFQALIWTSEDRNEHAPLIVRYALSYSPSLAALKYAQGLSETAYPQATFLGVADPDSGDPDVPRLPGAQTEAKTVAKLFPISEVYVDKQATEDVVQSESATAREILLSTHGLFNPHNPLYSYLLVTPTEENNDGKLFAHEVFSLPLHADMVVLSACETLLPSLEDMTDQLNKIARRAGDDESKELTEDQLKELTTGDEVVGLTRAFISAGASSVLSSLWSVPSDATSQLMVLFYEHVQEGMEKAYALRAAQLEVMNTTGWTQPWYWAAFNLVGDWR